MQTKLRAELHPWCLLLPFVPLVIFGILLVYASKKEREKQASGHQVQESTVTSHCMTPRRCSGSPPSLAVPRDHPES